MFRIFDWLENISARRSRVVGSWLVILFFLLPIPTFEFSIGGDTYEYLAMTNAFRNHYSPDIRLEDEPVGGVRPAVGLYESSRTGAPYAWHFWLYSLCVAPLVSLPYPWGGDLSHSFATLNRLIFGLALWCAVFTPGLSRAQRVFWVVLSALSVVAMYLRWVGPELFCWSLVTTSLSFFSGRRYVGACACAALAAMQNPPLLFLAFCYALFSVSTSSRRVILLSFFASLTSLLPMAFYKLHFGSISLIALHGQASWRFFSLERLFSFFFDLNFGVFFYVPVLVALWAGALWLARTKYHVASLNLVIVVMLISSLFTVQWSAANMGVFRYAVWMIPIMAFIVVSTYKNERVIRYATFAALATQLFLINDLPGWLQWRGAARFALQHAPQLYSPQPEIFVDYTLGIDTKGEEWKEYLPVAFFDDNDNATKVLTTSQTLPALAQHFRVDESYLNRMLHDNAGRRGRFYLHPPAGAIQAVTNKKQRKTFPS